MKKTLIALVALSGLAMGEFNTDDIVVYAPSFGDGSIEKTNANAAITFGNGSTSLDSWIFEFTTTNPQVGPNKAIFSTHKTDSSYDGLSVVAWTTNTNRPFGAAVLNPNGTYNTFSKSLFNDFATTSPATMRLAYDAQNDMAYLYNVTSGGLITIDSVSTALRASETKDNLKLTAGVSSMRAFNETMTLGKIYDLTNVATAGNTGKADFVAFIANPTPEPTTATLGLLALAGLVARRKRH